MFDVKDWAGKPVLRKGRKEYFCSTCGEIIKVGDRCTVQSLRIGGVWCTERTCVRCLEVGKQDGSNGL